MADSLSLGFFCAVTFTRWIQIACFCSGTHIRTWTFTRCHIRDSIIYARQYRSSFNDWANASDSSTIPAPSTWRCQAQWLRSHYSRPERETHFERRQRKNKDQSILSIVAMVAIVRELEKYWGQASQADATIWVNIYHSSKCQWDKFSRRPIIQVAQVD